MRYIRLSIFFACCDCLALAAIVFVNSSDIKEKSIKMLSIASFFWISLILECVCLYKAGKRKGRIRQPNKLFFSNNEAKVVDICMIGTLISFVVLHFLHVIDKSIILPLFAFLFFTVNLHFLFNSKTYNRCKVSK